MVIDPARMRSVLDMPEPDWFVADGERLPIAGREVRAIWTPGHTPGHLCLHDAAAGVLLTGDHMLPRITPNISVHGERDTDPLSDYLASLARTGNFAAEEALPAHEYRFRGLDVRSAALIAHHHERGAEILHVIDRLGEPDRLGHRQPADLVPWLGGAARHDAPDGARRDRRPPALPRRHRGGPARLRDAAALGAGLTRRGRVLAGRAY